VERRPPTFAAFFSKAPDISKPFEKQLVNAIREEFQLYGIPFRVIQKKRKSNLK
jgi:predicted GTPase